MLLFGEILSAFVGYLIFYNILQPRKSKTPLGLFRITIAIFVIIMIEFVPHNTLCLLQGDTLDCRLFGLPWFDQQYCMEISKTTMQDQ